MSPRIIWSREKRNPIGVLIVDPGLYFLSVAERTRHPIPFDGSPILNLVGLCEQSTTFRWIYQARLHEGALTFQNPADQKTHVTAFTYKSSSKIALNVDDY